MVALIALFIPVYTIWAIYDYVKKKNDLFSFIEQNLGKDVLKTVKSKKHYIGMPAPLLIYVIGRPDKVMKNVDTQNTYHHYLYGEYKNRLGNIKYKYRITCLNGYVESFGNA